MANNTEMKEQKRVQTKEEIEQKPTGFLKIAVKRFFRHKLGIIGLVLFAFFVLTSVFANQLSHHSVTEQNLRNRFSPPTFNLIKPTGTVATENVAIYTMNNGEIYSQDVTFGIPAWYQNLEMEIVTPPAYDQDHLYLGTENNKLLALSLANGSEVWAVELDQELESVWSTADGVLANSGDQFFYFSADGQEFWRTTVPGTFKKVTGKMTRPFVLNEAGDLFSFTLDGEQEKVTSFTDNIPEMAHFEEEQLFFYSGGNVFSFNLYAEELEQLGSVGDVRNEPKQIYPHANKLALFFSDSFTIGFNLEDNEKVWENKFTGEIIGSRPGDGSRLETFWNNGRHRIINMETGGTTSSRMVQGFSDVHYLGTDELGRDVFTRILHGGRVSLSLGVIVSVVCVTVGTLVGATSAYYGGMIDNLIMRFVDFLLSLPPLPVLMILTYILGPSFETMILALAILGWMGVARIVRSQTLSLKEQDFTQAAKALGATDWRIIVRHIIPNVIAPVLVAATLQVAQSILAESQLSYLGLGIQPPTPSWGNMLMNARQYLTTAPWLAIWPGLFIFLTLLSINFMGDAMRDALDPKLKGRD